MITLINGQKILMVDGFTFGRKTKKHWYCSKKLSTGCAAKVYLNPKSDDEKDLVITHCDNEHCHERPVYRKTSSGYLKISR